MTTMMVGAMIVVIMIPMERRPAVRYATERIKKIKCLDTMCNTICSYAYGILLMT